MKKYTVIFILLSVFCVFLPAAEGCTAAVISPAASACGRPILWKNRDTGFLSNKVVYVKEQPFSYIALVNSHATDGRHVFAGLNSAGFGIINTVACNLPTYDKEMKDLEGIIMADALRTCRTVTDFAAYLKTRLGPDLGSQSTFGVMDSSGKTLLFEVYNHASKILDPEKEKNKYLVVTNFARSGPENKGAGYLRFCRASRLFSRFPQTQVSFETILTEFTRDTGHCLLSHENQKSWKKHSAKKPNWIFARDCICRPSTSAAVVMVGRDPEVPGSVATMWIIPGQPLCAPALPLWVESASVPAVFHAEKESLLWQYSLDIKKKIYPLKGGNRHQYLDTTALDNSEGTGFLPRILALEQDIFRATRRFLTTSRTADQMAEFQKIQADKALILFKHLAKSGK